MWTGRLPHIAQLECSIATTVVVVGGRHQQIRNRMSQAEAEER